MIQKESILGHIVSYDPDSVFQDLDTILASRFGDGELQKGLDDLYDPYLLPDMEKAVTRIKHAFDEKERVVIFGDYDVDGVTSTALLVHLFKKVGFDVSYRLPHRVEDGYGLKVSFIDELEKLGVKLIITVDCGTRDIEVIQYAKEKGIDIIVTDHHSVPDEIPKEAVAIVNPKRRDSKYPFDGLCGAGIAFKLVCALVDIFLPENERQEYIQNTLDITAIGTVADCMTLHDENRIIVQAGLKQLHHSRSLGLKKMLEFNNQPDYDADIFGFFIGPRINAAGRLDSAYKALNLLINNSPNVYEIVNEIEQLNQKRRQLTTEFYEDALLNINPDHNIIFYVNSDIHQGIVGIIAGRLTEKYYKPSIVLKDTGDMLVASCRSPEYFSIIEVLEEFKEYFLHFGGHKQAAGFSISKEKFPAFQKAMYEKLDALDFSGYKKTLQIDKLITEKDFGFTTLDIAKQYQPYGLGNPSPLFLWEKVEIQDIKYLGKGIEHMQITTNNGVKFLGFGLGQLFSSLKNIKHCDIVFEFIEDYYMGKRQLKARIVDILVNNIA